MGSNGGVGKVLLVDGFIGGLWWWRQEAVELNVFVTLTREQRAELEEEVERMRGLLARPAASAVPGSAAHGRTPAVY